MGIKPFNKQNENFLLAITEFIEDNAGSIILTRDSANSNVATQINFKNLFNSEGKMDRMKFVKKDLGSPSDGWPAFYRNLQEMGINTIPNYHSIPGYSIDADEGGVTF